METGVLQQLLSWIAENPGWAGAAIFVIAFVESLVVIGFFLPGILILFGVGALIGLGETSWLPVWIGGSLGALCGDLLSFWIGHRYQNHLRRMWPFSRYPGMLLRGTEFVRRHGAKSIIAGRFIGPLRPVIPTTVGMMGMPLGRFLLICIPACVAWTPAYLVPGMLFGASLDVAADYAGRLALVVGLGVGILWLSLWFIRSVYEFGAVYSARWMRRAIRWTRRHPVLGRVVGPIIDPSQPEVLSVSMLGLLLVATLCGLLLLLLLGPFGAEPGARDLAVLDWTLTLRNDITDPIMVAISQLSRLWVLLPTLIATALWLLGANRYNAAAHWMVAMGGAFLLQLLMEWTLRAMPLAGLSGESLTFLPSAQLTLATVMIGFFTVMVAKELRRRHRKWPYLAATVLLTSLVMARIYLGMDWLSGALLGFILGLAWTAIVGMAYRARALRPFSGTMASTIFYGTLLITLVWQIGVHLEEDMAAVRLPVAERPLDAQAWWTGQWADLPTQRNRSANPAARNFNLQVAMTPAEAERALAPLGWQPVGKATWQWFLKSMNPDADERTLPLTGRNFLGQGEALVLRHDSGNPQRQLVLRLWDSGVRLQPGGAPVYLGQLYPEVLSQRLWLFSHWQPELPEAGYLKEFARSLDGMETSQTGGGLLLIRPSRLPGSGAESRPGPAGDPADP